MCCADGLMVFRLPTQTRGLHDRRQRQFLPTPPTSTIQPNLTCRDSTKAGISPHFLRPRVTYRPISFKRDYDGKRPAKLVLKFYVITSIITSILIGISHNRKKVTSVLCFHILWNRPCKIIISNTEICQCRDICNL